MAKNVLQMFIENNLRNINEKKMMQERGE